MFNLLFYLGRTASNNTEDMQQQRRIVAAVAIDERAGRGIDDAAEERREQQFGTKRLQEAILAARGKPARLVVEHVVERVAAFTNGAPQSDDITCVAVCLPLLPASEPGPAGVRHQ